MSRERLADAYEEQSAIFARLADTTAQIAHELRGIDSPARPGENVGTGQAGLPPQSGSVPTVPSFDELPPEGFNDAKAEPALSPQLEMGLGRCPVHGKPWTIKAAGVSRAGEAYEAFYKCAEKDEAGGYCKQKPQKIWRDTHPIPGTAAA